MFSETANARVSSFDVNCDGDLLFAAADEKAIHVFDLVRGEHRLRLSLTDRGVGTLCATPHKSTLAFGGLYGPPCILSVHDNTIIRDFPCEDNSGRVISLDHSSREDLLLSGSTDRTVKLWDVRRGNCVWMMKTPSPARIAFDPSGVVFACATRGAVVKMFDVRNTIKPFLQQPIEFHSGDEGPLVWANVMFAPDPEGKYLALGTNRGRAVVLDSFTLFKVAEMNTCEAEPPAGDIFLEACWSADASMLVFGSESGKVSLFYPKSPYPIACLDGGHPGPSRLVRWSTKNNQFFSVCSFIAEWLPRK